MQAGRAGQAPGDKEFTNSIGMRLVCIDPGFFSMGQQAGGDWDERPVHNVDITKTFYDDFRTFYA
jgi:formylglycine-generating enzyme required for sulfatase activity